MKQRKRPKRRRVGPTRLVNSTTEIFNPINNKPGLKNMVLTIIAIALCPKFKINEISRHLPVSVETEKTKQKRLLRFIDSKFPKKEVLHGWARFVLETVYPRFHSVNVPLSSILKCTPTKRFNG